MIDAEPEDKIQQAAEGVCRVHTRGDNPINCHERHKNAVMPSVELNAYLSSVAAPNLVDFCSLPIACWKLAVNLSKSTPINASHKPEMMLKESELPVNAHAVTLPNLRGGEGWNLGRCPVFNRPSHLPQCVKSRDHSSIS
jgi:hypothetical protein